MTREQFGQRLWVIIYFTLTSWTAYRLVTRGGELRAALLGFDAAFAVLSLVDVCQQRAS